MGLAIGVGVLAGLIRNDAEGAEWMRKSIASLNRVLVKNGLAEHHEPEELPPFKARSVRGYPYSFLHYLRRAYACVIEKKPIRTGNLTDRDMAFISDVTVTLMDSHLLSHSDAEGYYVPQSFRDPLCDDSLPGGFAGSIHYLLRELYQVGPAIGIACKGGNLAPEEVEKLAQIADDDPLAREKVVWFSLYEAAKYCKEHGCLLVFH